MTEHADLSTHLPASSLGGSASAQLRVHMPVAKNWAYFDHAAVAPLTAAAAAAMSDYVRQAAEQGDVQWPQWAMAVERLRDVAAKFLGAEQAEIALVSNTTQGISLVAEGYPWIAGDNVVVPDNEFPSNLLPWRMLARRGVELRRLTVDRTGVLDLSQLARIMDARTRMVSLSWVGFLSGYRIDVGEVAEAVHRRGALLMLDAIQGLGAFQLDVKATGVDFVAADGHKWMLGPEGAGVLYLREEHLDRIQPQAVGWNSLAGGGFDPNSVNTSLKLKDSAARFEGGSMNMPGMIGLGQSLNLLRDLHASADLRLSEALSPISSAVVTNASQLAERLRQRGFRALIPESVQRRSGIVGISWTDPSNSNVDVPEHVAIAARKHCLAAGVVLSVRSGRLRASTHAYNNEHDIERLIDALVHFRKTYAG